MDTTTYFKRFVVRRASVRIPHVAEVGSSGVAGAVKAIAAKGLTVAAPLVAVGLLAGAARWLFTRQDVSDITDAIEVFNKDEDEGERQDGGMDGEDVFLERTDPIDHNWHPPLEVGVTRDVECPKCKFAMRADDDDVWTKVSCPSCGYGPVGVRKPRNKRYCRGHMNLLRDAMKEFPYRMDHPNRKLAQQQVYTYMLRRSKELRWTVKDQTMLPALAAMAFIVHTRGEVDARRMQQSAWAEAEEFEYDVAGSKYPNIRRIFHKLRVFSY